MNRVHGAQIERHISARSWTQITLAGPYLAGGILLSILLARMLNILTLGDDVATGLGLRVELARLVFLALGALTDIPSKTPIQGFLSCF